MKRNKTSFVILIVISIVVSLSMIIGGAISLAAYTNSLHAQRTVATYQPNGDRFSSNYLAKLSLNDNLKSIYTSDEGVEASAIVTLFNHERGKTTPYENTIYYSLRVYLVYNAGTELTPDFTAVDESYLTANSLTGYHVYFNRTGQSVNTLGSGNLSVTLDGNLEAASIDQHAFHIAFDTDFVTEAPNLYVAMVATPFESAANRTAGTPASSVLPVLCAVFDAKLRSEGIENAWTGAFSDDKSAAPSAYDGYNYRISGVGSGTVTLTWNSAKVVINDFDKIELLKIDGATLVGSTLTFAVNSDDAALYDIRFVKVGIGAETWPDMESSVVTFSFS